MDDINEIIIKEEGVMGMWEIYTRKVFEDQRMEKSG